MTYQPKVYRKQGGDELVIASGGNITVESGGTLDIEGVQTIKSALTVPSGGTLSVASGGLATVDAGGAVGIPYQALGSSQVAIPVNSYGVSFLVGTTTGPAYTMAAPTAAGVIKDLVLNPTSSGVTHSCTVFSGSTGRAFVHDSASGNTITLNTSAQGGIRLVSQGSTAWRVIGAFAVKDPALSNKST